MPDLKLLKHRIQLTGLNMAKPNYSFQKRQRDLAKKIKKEEKKAKKAAAKGELPEQDESVAPPADDTPAS